MKIRFPLFIVLAMIFACETQQDFSKNEAPYLRLDTREEYEAIARNIETMSDEDVVNWEKQNGFTSYRTVFRSVSESISAAQSEAEIDRIIESNKHIVKLENEMVMPVIKDPLYQVLANEHGYFEANHKIFKVSPEYLYSANTADKDLLTSLLLEDSVENEKITSQQYARASDNAVNLVPCVTSLQADYFENHSGCDRDSRVYLYFTSQRYCGSSPFDPPLPNCTFQVVARIENFARIPISCKYVNHSATLSMNNVRISIAGYNIQGTPATQFGWFMDRTFILTTLPNAVPYTNKPFPFTTAYGEGSSAKVSGGSAIINFVAPPGICY